jgi:hypothetical protein
MSRKGKPQAVKGRNIGWMRAEQDRRRSSVAEPHRNKARYHRPSEKRIKFDV